VGQMCEEEISDVLGDVLYFRQRESWNHGARRAPGAGLRRLRLWDRRWLCWWRRWRCYRVRDEHLFCSFALQLRGVEVELLLTPQKQGLAA
jgi:hypothetical protein